VRRPRITPARVLLGGLAAAQVGYGRAGRARPPATTRALLLAMLATSATEAVEARGARRGALAIVVPGAVGFAAELLGVASGRPFGRYSYSAQLGPRVCGVPLLAAAAWSIMARPAWIAAGWITRDRAARVTLAAAGLTAWDVYLDPRMAAEGYWTWAEGGRYEGIPASNFAGWFATAACAFSLSAALDHSAPGPRDDGALGLYAWTWIGEGFANALLWRRPVTAAAGAAAMGAVAVPALLRRSRA
jgi:putative membrane protein